MLGFCSLYPLLSLRAVNYSSTFSLVTCFPYEQNVWQAEGFSFVIIYRQFGFCSFSVIAVKKWNWPITFLRMPNLFFLVVLERLMNIPASLICMTLKLTLTVKLALILKPNLTLKPNSKNLTVKIPKPWCWYVQKSCHF